MSLFRARSARPRDDALRVVVALETGETLRGRVIRCEPGALTVEMPTEPLLPLMDPLSIRLRSRRDRFDEPFLARAVDWAFEAGQRRYTLALDLHPAAFMRLPRSLKSQFNRRACLRVDAPRRPAPRARCDTPLLGGPVEGVVRDVSASGLGLIVEPLILPRIELIRRLDVQLTLPGEGPIEVAAQLRHHEELPGDKVGLGLMIVEGAAQRRAAAALARYVVRRQAELLRRRIPRREIRR